MKNDRQYNGQNDQRQIIPWSKGKTTDNTMVKMKHDRQYHGQNEKRQTIQWSK